MITKRITVMLCYGVIQYNQYINVKAGKQIINNFGGMMAVQKIKRNDWFNGFLLIAILFILSSCGKPKDLKIGEIHDVKVKSINLSGVELQGMVPIQNPNSYAITIKEADLNLSADNQIVAHITQTSPPVTLDGNSSADHTISIRIDLLHPGEISSMMNLFSGKSVLNLDGTVRLSSFVFTKNVAVHQTNVQDYLKPVINNFKLF